MSARHNTPRTNLVLSMACILFATIIAGFWVQHDSGSGMVLKVRRQVSIGDAMAPTVAALIIGLGGILLFFERNKSDQARLCPANIIFILKFLGLLIFGFSIIRWAGSASVWLAAFWIDDMPGYRELRGNAPWKYIGFFLGGTFLITSMLSFSESRIRPRNIVIAILAIGFLIVLYDVPFNGLQLPPNGDL